MITAFGKNLKALRKDNKLTQRELADKIGVTHVTLVKYENGGCYPQREEIKKALLKVLKCSEVELYGYSDGYYETSKYIQPATNDTKKCHTKEAKIISEGTTEKVSEEGIMDLKNNKFYRIKGIKRAIDKDIVDKFPNGYLLKMDNDSMDRFIPKNSFVYISKEKDSNDYNNHICAITKDGFTITFRRITYLPYDELIALIPQSTNTKYKSETIENKNKGNFAILGRARWFSNDGGDL